MKPLELVTFEQAGQMIDAEIRPVERKEVIPLDEAAGRVLAADVSASHWTPPFDRATMDGYTVISADIQKASRDKPVPLKIIEEVFAGSVPHKELAHGQAAQVATGACLPEGADAVVMVEVTSRDDGMVYIGKPAVRGENISPKGSDIKKGEMLLKAGAFLYPARIGVLASQGLAEVEVFVRPVIAIMPTGEEVVAVGGVLEAGQIYDINSHTLAAVVRQNGCHVMMLPITGDRLDSLKTSFDRALVADMVVTSGGSSVGERDYMGELLKSMGDVKYHGVRLKPGKPSAFAVVKGKPVLCMPGHPTSCLINAYLLLAPALRKMARLPARGTETVNARLGENIKGAAGRTMFMPVMLKEGKVYSAFKGSGAITSTARADGYIVIPDDAELAENSEVGVTLF